jgi:hypothetical protein
MFNVADRWKDPIYGSHLEPLLRCVFETNGPVLEIGMGYWSTPVLHIVCTALSRKLVSVETNEEWGQSLESEYPHTRMGLDSLGELAKSQWSVVFVDSEIGENRAEIVKIFCQSADFIVVHDCNLPSVLGKLEAVLNTWNGTLQIFSTLNPSTAVLSAKSLHLK